MTEKIYKVGIVDDEDASREILEDIISNIPFNEIVLSTNDPFKAIEFIEKEKVDILFLDMEMKGFNGLEVAKRIQHKNIPIIVCTAFEKYGVQSYKYNVVYYIIKIANEFEVSLGLDKAKKTLENKSKLDNHFSGEMVVVNPKGEGKKRFVKTLEIKFIEQQGPCSTIYLINGEKVSFNSRFYETLERVKRPYIVRVHRSFAVNVMNIKELDHGHCIFDEKTRIPIGPDYHEPFSQFLRNNTLL